MEKQKRNIDYSKRRKRQPNPLLWVSGPDPTIHLYHRYYTQQVNQAKWRGEGWDDEFTFTKWLEKWGDIITERGRKCGKFKMSREDTSTPWSYNNTVLVKIEGKTCR